MILRKLSFKKKLIIAFIGVVLIMGAISIYSSSQLIRNKLEQALYEQTMDITGGVENSIEEKKREILELTSLYAGLKKVVDYTSYGMKHMVRREIVALRKSGGLASLEIRDTSGKLFATAKSAGELFAAAQEGIEESEVDEYLVERVLNGNSEIYLDDRGSKIGIWAVVPLEKFNEIIGMMQASYLLDLNFIEELKRITTADISLFTRKKLSLTTLPTESFSLKPELLNEMLIKRRKLVDNIVIADESYKIGLTPLLKKDGTFLGMIMASLPKKGMISLASEARNRLLMIGCLGVFLALLVGYLIAEYLISRPISKLAKGAAAISRGDLNQEIIIDTQDEIGVLASTFNEMRKKLREAKQLEEQLQRSKKLAALGEMSAGVAHEIRNPLGVIKSSAQMLRDEFTPLEGKEEYQELNTFIIEEVNRLNRVITEFLSFARPTPPDLQKVNINEIIDKTLRLITSEEKVTPDVKIKVESNKNLPLVMADPEQIVQALLDIALNGLQAMSDGGELRIAAKRAEDAEGKYPASLVQIQITDTGEGIPPSIRDKIFNPFFTTKEEGSGLGLAIVHKIIENHKGFIEVESEVGKGTAFKIFLPLTA